MNNFVRTVCVILALLLFAAFAIGSGSDDGGNSNKTGGSVTEVAPTVTDVIYDDDYHDISIHFECTENLILNQ